MSCVLANYAGVAVSSHRYLLYQFEIMKLEK